MTSNFFELVVTSIMQKPALCLTHVCDNVKCQMLKLKIDGYDKRAG